MLTPATAGGHEARCFGFNTRFATPALAVGLILLPLAVSRTRRGPLVSVLVLAVTLALTVHPSHERAAIVGAAVLLAGAALVGTGAGRALPRPATLALVAAFLPAVVIGGRHEQQAYAGTRYVTQSYSDPVAPLVRRLRPLRRARIAVTGLSETYPFYGADLSNRVDYPARRDGARFLPYTTCRGWLRALRRGRYDYVVTARESTAAAAAAEWTRRAPGARELLSSPPGATNRGEHWTWQLFALDPTRLGDPGATCG